jgi:hypothetical protein
VENVGNVSEELIEKGKDYETLRGKEEERQSELKLKFTPGAAKNLRIVSTVKRQKCFEKYFRCNPQHES